MKRLIPLVFFLVTTILQTAAQPSWVKKASKLVFTIKTFAADGTMIGESNGFFVGTNGEAVSNFAPFRGASKAVAIDANGKEMPIVSLLGANDLYDLVKFRVSAGKTTPMDIAAAPATTGTTLWLVPYTAKKAPTAFHATVVKKEKVDNDYDYYTLDMSVPSSATSCPILNETGEVVAMLQQPTAGNDKTAYAVGVKFPLSLKISGLSLNDHTLKSCAIKKELPNEFNQAVLAIYVAQNAVGANEYKALVDDFIAKFPNAADGYEYRAQIAAGEGRYSDADAAMQQAIKVADKKDEPHFTYAKIIYQTLLSPSTAQNGTWTLAKALDETDAAISINPLPLYKEQRAQILYAEKRYAEAYDIFVSLATTNLGKAAMLSSAASCKERIGDTAAVIALLDSAVNSFTKPYTKEAAPYILAYGQALHNAGKYRAAVIEYNQYEQLMAIKPNDTEETLPQGLNDAFYYLREQSELQGRLFQQALNDITKAISLNPGNATYYAEKAMIELRVNMIDKAIATANECIKADPTLSDGPLLLGIAQCEKGDKQNGLANLKRANDLGNQQAVALIERYSK